MANFEAHLNQAKQNLRFLNKVNTHIDNAWDWKVTICFYSAVHFVNAYLVETIGTNYRTHEQVKEALNPYNRLSVTKVPENIYTAYVKLMGLSRRSRYLCKENGHSSIDSVELTYDKHLSKSVTHLDTIIDFFRLKYDFDIESVTVNCIEIKTKHLKYFQYGT